MSYDWREWRSKNRIPDTVGKCFLRANPVAEKIESFVNVLHYIGIILLIGIIIAGLYNTWQVWEVSQNDTLFMSQEAAANLVLSTFITWVVYAVIEFIAWRVLSLTLEAIASIAQNSENITNLSAYIANKVSGESENKDQENSN